MSSSLATRRANRAPLSAPPGTRKLTSAILLCVSEMVGEPGACLIPVALDRAQRRVESLGGFLFGQPGEEAALDDLGLARIDPGEVLQRFVESRELLRLR